jgi:hypothetical protein
MKFTLLSVDDGDEWTAEHVLELDTAEFVPWGRHCVLLFLLFAADLFRRQIDGALGAFPRPGWPVSGRTHGQILVIHARRRYLAVAA